MTTKKKQINVKQEPKKEPSMKELKFVDGLAEFPTLSGYTFKLRPINLMDISRARGGTEILFREKGEKLDPPKIMIPVAGDDDQGVEQTVTGEIYEELKRQKESGEIDESLADNIDTIISEFEKYQDAISRLLIETNNNTMRVLLSAITNLPPMVGENGQKPDWIKQREKMGILDVPEIGPDGDTFERERYFIIEIALVTKTSFLELQGAIMFISSEGAMKWEDVSAAADMFRDSIREIVAESIPEDTAGDDAAE